MYNLYMYMYYMQRTVLNFVGGVHVATFGCLIDSIWTPYKGNNVYLTMCLTV